jgi:hypothetical protein
MVTIEIPFVSNPVSPNEAKYQEAVEVKIEILNQWKPLQL